MYARLQTVRSLPAEGRGENSRRLVDAVCTHPGFAGICLATQLGRPAGACLTLWETHEDAEAASARTRAQLGPRPFPLATDDVYEVIDHVRHSEPVDAAAVVNLVWLDGPRSPEQQAADELSGMRIKRALQAVDGHRLTPGGARGRPEAVPTRGEAAAQCPAPQLALLGV